MNVNLNLNVKVNVNSNLVLRLSGSLFQTTTPSWPEICPTWRLISWEKES